MSDLKQRYIVSREDHPKKVVFLIKNMFHSFNEVDIISTDTHSDVACRAASYLEHFGYAKIAGIKTFTKLMNFREIIIVITMKKTENFLELYEAYEREKPEKRKK